MNKKMTVYRIVAFALAFVMIVAMLTFTLTSSAASKTIDVVVLVNDVAAGRKIKSTDIEVRTYKNVNIPSNVISDKSLVSGKYAKVDLFAGEYVYEAQISKTSQATSSAEALIQAITTSKENYVVVTDYFLPNTGADLTSHIQNIINKNPGRTIYFPDGEYVISSGISTCGTAAKAVSLLLADGAVIKASDSWKNSNEYTAMICLGAQDVGVDGSNDVDSQGSYYSLMGGTLDCNGVTNGLAINGGRESLVKNILIKNVKNKGIEITKGANNGSSDMDIDDVTIIGTGTPNSIGMHLDKGYDNTFTNIRIYDFQTGVIVSSGGNSFHDVRVFNTHTTSLDSLYDRTEGFKEVGHVGNFYFQCYVEDCATAFSFNGDAVTIDSCTAIWTDKAKGLGSGIQTAFVTTNSFKAVMSSCKAVFVDDGTKDNNTFFSAEKGGNGKLESPIFDSNLCNTKHESYVRSYSYK